MKKGTQVLGIYDQIWSSSDRLYLQDFIDKTALLQDNYMFWKSQFSVDNNTTATNPDGTSVFTIAAYSNSEAGMADFRAPLAATELMDKNGLDTYQGTIPDLSGKGYRENAIERDNKEEIVTRMFGDESRIVLDYINELQKIKNSVDARISYMGAQLMTTGSVIGRNDVSGQIFYQCDAPIPSANRVKAGTYVWSNTTNCDIIAQMQKIENDFRDSTGYTGAMKWQVTSATFRNYIMGNAKLKTAITDYRKNMGLGYVNTQNDVAESWVNEYLNVLGICSPIEIVKEGEILATMDSRNVVHGWADTYAVLRPVGYAGKIKYALPKDVILYNKFAGQNPAVKVSVALIDSFMWLVNKVNQNADLPEWHSDIFCSAVPVLTEWPHHVIVNTTVAD